MHYPKYLQLDLVHRLDKDTSGCIIIAKRHSMLRAMHKLLRQGQIIKKYHALIKGKIQNKQDVDVPLCKYHLSSGERLVKVEYGNGQDALTRFKPITCYSSAMLLEAMPITGRTHQIRVHAKHIGCPIAGDEKYGDKEFNKTIRKHGLKRLFLHAYSLEIKDPKTEKLISVQAPYDANLILTIDNLNKKKEGFINHD